MEMVGQGYINQQQHPDYDLWIYNYGPKAQYERNWNAATLAARGLILDGAGNVVARPFPKFFNMAEHSRSDITFSKPFVITDKMDGSLGISYRLPTGYPAIATRGSFSSEQAKWATEHLYESYPEFVAEYKEINDPTTWLFEIIYPENRIVVDYGGMADLVLLAVIDLETGRDADDRKAWWPGQVVKTYDVSCKPRDVVEQLKPTDDGNTEGYVLRFDWPKVGPQARVKVKLEEYCRLHRILTGVSNLSIWEYLKDGKDMNELLDKVPDEFYDWVKSTVRGLQDQFLEILSTTTGDMSTILYKKLGLDADEGNDSYETQLAWVRDNARGQFAGYVKEFKYPGLLFHSLDENYDKRREAIWKMIRPKFSKPFSNVSSEDT